MKWLKHYCDAHHDEDMEMLIDQYGLEAYAVWWILLEHLGSQLDSSNKTSLTLSPAVWKKNLRISWKKLEKILSFLKKTGKILMEISENSPIVVTIDCPKLLKFRDEYTQRKEKYRDKVPIVSGESPEQDKDIDKDLDKDTDKDKIQWSQIKDMWNVKAKKNGLAKIQEISEDRKIKFRVRWSHDGWNNLDFWSDYFDKLMSIPFYRGENDKNWRATFDYAIKADRIVLQILEKEIDTREKPEGHW